MKTSRVPAMKSSPFLRSVIISLLFLLYPNTGDSQSTEAVPEDKQTCIEEFLEWCQKNQYDINGTSASVLSMSFYDDGQKARIYCTVDEEGTECIKNKSPWFHCFPNKTLEYKGQPLTADSVADDDICSSKKSAMNFDNQVRFNRTQFEKEFKIQMKHFYEEMENFHRRMKEMQTQFFSRDFPFIGFDDDDRSDERSP